MDDSADGAIIWEYDDDDDDDDDGVSQIRVHKQTDRRGFDRGCWIGFGDEQQQQRNRVGWVDKQASNSSLYIYNTSENRQKKKGKKKNSRPQQAELLLCCCCSNPIGVTDKPDSESAFFFFIFLFYDM